ncbi:MAG: type I glyceraldehyde-3-phosphate dehydrogenase [Candidatus Dependentiae bacterium]
MRIAINGFGRIGRNFLRVILSDKIASQKITIVAINIGPGHIANTAHLFKYDTLMGTYHEPVLVEDNYLVIGNNRIQLYAIAEPADLPWKSLDIDWVVDASGKFTKRELAEKHLQAGAKAVLITAPAKGDDISIIPGINDAEFDKQKHKIVSLGSCTTNAFMPILKIINDACEIEQGFMTTVHAYTNSQVLLDVEDKDLRMSRAAALNIIPAGTGAAKMIGKVIPSLENKIKATALRVPVAKVSLMDVVLITKKKSNIQQINDLFISASQTSLKGIVALSQEPLVSSDYSGSPYSVVIDGLLTGSFGNMHKICGWYDNEWGYSERLKDFLILALK